MAKPTKRPGPARNAGVRVNKPSALQRYSAPILARLHGLPRWLFPIFTATLLVGGLLVPNAIAATILLSALSLILAWLIALSWPVLRPIPRLMRLLVLGALVMVVVGRAQGRM